MIAKREKNRDAQTYTIADAGVNREGHESSHSFKVLELIEKLARTKAVNHEALKDHKRGKIVERVG